MRHIECHQLRERYPYELHLPPEHPHRRAMVGGPGDTATVHQMIDLANARRPPDEVGKSPGGVVDVQGWCTALPSSQISSGLPWRIRSIQEKSQAIWRSRPCLGP